jgi:hypothetical protein
MSKSSSGARGVGPPPSVLPSTQSRQKRIHEMTRTGRRALSEGAALSPIGRGPRLAALAIVLLILALPAFAGPDGQWVLETSSLTYHVSHPLHETEGVSHAARGRANCQAGQCDVLIAAPVKSFDSGDSNRDLHMLQATHGAQFPMISVRIRLPASDFGTPTIYCDIEIDFAGQTARYKHVSFQQVIQGDKTHISGTIPATLSDFKIPRPSFLAVPVKDELPVRVETTWRPM